MAAADTRGFHRARSRKIGRAETHAVHARRCIGDRAHILDALRRLQNGMNEDRLAQTVSCFELRQELVEVIDIPCAFDLRQHDHVELIAHGCNDLDDVVEHPRRVQRIDAHPQSGQAERILFRHRDEARARRGLGIGGNSVFETPMNYICEKAARRDG